MTICLTLDYNLHSIFLFSYYKYFQLGFLKIPYIQYHRFREELLWHQSRYMNDNFSIPNFIMHLSVHPWFLFSFFLELMLSLSNCFSLLQGVFLVTFLNQDHLQNRQSTEFQLGFPWSFERILQLFPFHLLHNSHKVLPMLSLLVIPISRSHPIYFWQKQIFQLLHWYT